MIKMVNIYDIYIYLVVILFMLSFKLILRKDDFQTHHYSKSVCSLTKILYCKLNYYQTPILHIYKET